jgi:hypothetical protein
LTRGTFETKLWLKGDELWNCNRGKDRENSDRNQNLSERETAAICQELPATTK